jgi:phenylalanyl-tRNA synthetase alpha chain
VEKDLQAIVEEATLNLSSVNNRADWDNVKSTILGPNGSLTRIAKSIGGVAKEDRPAFGQALNRTKKQIEEIFKV